MHIFPYSDAFHTRKAFNKVGEVCSAQAAKEALGERAVGFVNRELCKHPGAQQK